MYRLLAGIYAQPPDQQVLELLAQWAYRLHSSSSSSELPHDMRNTLSMLHDLLGPAHRMPQIAEAAAVEFTRLFRGVKPLYSPPPPYESLYLDAASNQIFAGPASEVHQEYRRYGFTPADTLGNEPPDYISFELEFMHLLCDQESQAWESGDIDKVQQFHSAQKGFLSNHLISWAPKFFDEVVARDGSGLFSALAKFTVSWLELEHEQHLAEDA